MQIENSFTRDNFGILAQLEIISKPGDAKYPHDELQSAAHNH